MEQDYKKCPDCQEILPLEEFSRDSSKSTGYTTHCKKCKNVRAAASRKRIRAGMGQKKPEYTKLQAVRDLLQDGEWHTTAEIKAIGGICYQNRITALRQEGLRVDRKRDYGYANGWQYRLVLDPSEQPPAGATSPTEQLLNLLRDGHWHSNQEMFDLMDVSYQDHLYFLRKEGFVINKMRDPETGVWHYKLEVGPNDQRTKSQSRTSS